MPDGIETPMQAHPKLHIAKGFVGAGGSVVILGYRNFFNVRNRNQLARRKLVMGNSALPPQARGRSYSKGRGRQNKVSSVHHDVNPRVRRRLAAAAFEAP